MEFRFTLVDRNNTRTVIEEPVGWDSFSIRIKRHPQRHGTFRELQGNQFQFHGEAGRLLKLEYELYGIQGNYKLSIDWKCNRKWQLFFTGSISFDTYSFTCGPSCFVTAEIEQIGAVVAFMNRFDQKVEVGSNIAFDKTTVLTNYNLLSKVIALPSKTIVLRGISNNTDVQSYALSGDSGWTFGPSNTGTLQGSINPAFQNLEANSIKDYTPNSVIDFYRHISAGNEYTPQIIYNNPDQELNCNGTKFDIEFRMKGNFKNNNGGSGTVTMYLILRKGPNHFNDGSTNTDLGTWLIRNSNLAVFNQAFDVAFSTSTFLPPGHKIWCSFFITYIKTTNFAENVEISLDAETYFKAKQESKCDYTEGKVYLINETASRVTEAITNNELKVYSEYLGRKDSQPYSFDQPGCGALRSLTTGLDIRKGKLADGTDPKMFLSMEDIFNHLSATDNVGIGVEGTSKIRIENWKWFYKDSVIHRCKDVDTIKKSIRADQNYSVFKTGYDKWETEDFNGLDEFLTKREYRTDISQVQNTLEKVSKILASGYAIESTRRKQGNEKDWRYDNDIFAICLMNKIHCTGAEFNAISSTIVIPFNQLYQIGFQAHTIVVEGSVSNNGTFHITGVSTFLTDIVITVAEALVNEVGANITIEDISSHYAVEIGNVDNAANLVDPDTIYNFRISPARMAMKWFDKIMALHRHISATKKLYFSSGDGNYIAEGELKDPECKLESGVIKENDDLSLLKYDDQDEAKPINFLDAIVYNYPMGAGDFNKIASSIYDKIEYGSGCELGQGWIDELEYFPNEGKAKFNLIPSVEKSTVYVDNRVGILTEDGRYILTEDGNIIMPE